MAGSVFKRCTRCGNRVQKRKCGKCGSGTFNWAFRAYVGKDAGGRWMRQLRSGFGTRREAERALQELRSAVDAGAFVEASDVTVAEYLRDEWLPATAPPRVKYDTWKDRRDNLETHVIPRIGGVVLQDLNSAHLNRLYALLLASGRVRGKGGLSPTSVHRIHSILRKALNDAVRWGLLQRNPASQADPPPLKAVQAARRRGMRTWTATELHRFLADTADHDLHVMWLFCASTGVRRSELLGVRWTDLDLDAATVTVRQTITETAEGYEPEEDQKSSQSARTIHLDARVVAELRGHRTTQSKARLALGDAWQVHGLVFCQGDGSWWNPPAVTHAFRRAAKRAGVPVIRLHDLRHTHATLLLVAGVNPKVVSERLGHSSVAFTLDTYSHVMPGMQPEAAALFMDLVLAAPLHEEADKEDQDEDDTTETEVGS